MSADIVFTKDNLDSCLRALGKEFRRLNGKKVPAEIMLIGGAAVLVNYGFRDMTYDIDAVIQTTSAMKDAINTVGDSLGLPNGWLNSDFIKTKSYSPKLSQCSVYYKTFSNVLTVRTVSGITIFLISCSVIGIFLNICHHSVIQDKVKCCAGKRTDTAYIILPCKNAKSHNP